MSIVVNTPPASIKLWGLYKPSWWYPVICSASLIPAMRVELPVALGALKVVYMPLVSTKVRLI